MRDAARSSAKASSGDLDAARALARGLCVVGVSTDASVLPPALVGAADMKIVIAAPTPDTVRAPIAKFTRRPVADFPAGAGAGLDLPDLVAAFRPGSGHRKIGERLLRAAAATSNVGAPGEVPDLVDAIEYGEARAWGLSLAEEVAQYKAGLRFWRDLPIACRARLRPRPPAYHPRIRQLVYGCSHGDRSPNQQDQDEVNVAAMVKLIVENIAEGGQSIFGLGGDEAKVYEFTEKLSVLRTSEFEAVSARMAPLIQKAI